MDDKVLANFADGGRLMMSRHGEYWVAYPGGRRRLGVHMAVEWVVRDNAQVMDGVTGADRFYSVLDRARARQQGIR